MGQKCEIWLENGSLGLKNHFSQNFDMRTYFDTILGKSNFWRFSIFLKCGFGTFWAENTVLGAKKHKKVENHIF